MKTRIIGDIHGKFNDYLEVIDGCDRSIQIGDFGIGFFNDAMHQNIEEKLKDTDHKFFRGNHDDPGRCNQMAAHLGDFGIINDTMWIAGAWSIDWVIKSRTGHWWADEELSHRQWEQVLEMVAAFKPRQIISHDCPGIVSKQIFVDAGLGMPGYGAIKTKTGQALDAVMEIHKPEKWIFGHWHRSLTEVVAGIEFTCLAELESMDIDI